MRDHIQVDEGRSITLDPQRTGIRIPIWSAITGVIALLSFGIGIGWLAYSVSQTVANNIVINSQNHDVQMAAIASQTNLLRQIVCQNKWSLYNGSRNVSYRGECD